jgi:nucleotide-binding universal stress UspA family protein
MTHFLLATSSVHTTAAACDYLQGRLDGDRVTVLAVTEPGVSRRDAGDATNVARTRLVAPTVETAVREGTPADAIRAVARERGVDELVVGPRRGDPAAAGTAPGETVRALLADGELPVVVPLPELS